MRRFTIDCRAVSDFHDFVEAMNQGLIRSIGGEWNGHLDALNDYLSWPDSEEYELEFLGSKRCAQALGHDAQAEWLRERIATCHPSNREGMNSRLAEAERGHGQTLYDVLCQIVRENPHVQLLET